MSRTTLAAIGIVAVSCVIAVASAWNDAPIVDEIPHIGAGYGYVIEQSYQFNPEHPPLAKDLAGIGLKIVGADTTQAHQAFLAHAKPVNDQWTFGRQLLFGMGLNADNLVHASKLPVLIFFVLSALIIFVWTRRLYGPRAALIAIFLFAFSPTVIAHARLVTTDLAALFGVMLASYFYVQFLEGHNKHDKHAPSLNNKNLWFAGLALGIALLCKFSTFLLLPFFVLLAIGWAFAHRKSIWPLLGKTILIIIIALVVVVGPWYQLHVMHYPAAQQRADTTALIGNYSNQTIANAIIGASDKPILRPLAEYGLGLVMVTQRIEGGNRIYFLGEVVNQGGPWYFPIVYLLKEPIPFLILLLAVILLGLASLFKAKPKFFRAWLVYNFPAAAMLLWLLIYWAFSMNSTVNIGVRHLMPVYGFTIMLVAGYITKSYFYKKKYFKLIVAGLLVWQAAEFVSVYPSYLAYFNEFAGGPSGGHRYVTDSNLDWGQDLKRLGQWVKENKIQKLNLDYFGWADQRYYIGPAFNWIVGGQYTNKETFLRDNPQGGYIAISATYYEQATHSDTGYDWLKNISPLTTIGHSIYVWHITN